MLTKFGGGNMCRNCTFKVVLETFQNNDSNKLET